MICCRCKELIDQSKDKWVVIQDWEKGEKIAQKEMHIICWKNMYKEKMQNQIKMITEKLKLVIPNIQGLLPNIENDGK